MRCPREIAACCGFAAVITAAAPVVVEVGAPDADVVNDGFRAEG
jgi:hypothetical protein